MKFAVEGCSHGALDDIYRHIQSLEEKNSYKVDVALLCGDFQAIRNSQDLQCMAVPDKYKQLGQFYKYYTGEVVAPCLTIVIGGNHEASNYMWELFHGGWLAPNIYYLGVAGCIQINGIRIAGASGIYKRHDFRFGYFETQPYDRSAIRSIYHIREHAVRKLSLLTHPQIFLSHDWPQHIEHHGDLRGLLRRKPHFRADSESGQLGSPPLMGLLQTLQPEWWFSAHLHVKFEATYLHAGGEQLAAVGGDNPDEIQIDDEDEDVSPDLLQAKNNSDEIVLDDEQAHVATPAAYPTPARLATKFLALDKCLPRRNFLEVIDVDAPESSEGPPVLTFDPEWLAITRAFHPYLSLERQQTPFPDEQHARASIKKELDWTLDQRLDNMKVEECQKFVMTAPGPGPNETKSRLNQPPAYCNPQTVALCELLQIQNKINTHVVD